MQTDLEKTQTEIARVQLERERIQLANLQKRQKVVDGLQAGAVSVGGAIGGMTVRGAPKVGVVLRACLMITAFTFVVLLVTILIKAALLKSGYGFGHDFGYTLGSKAHIAFPAIVGMPLLYYFIRIFFARTTAMALLFTLCAVITSVFLVAA